MTTQTTEIMRRSMIANGKYREADKLEREGKDMIERAAKLREEAQSWAWQAEQIATLEEANV